MSKAAELTREELVERLARAINASDAASAGYPAWLMLVGSEREYYLARANTVLAELKALGLAVVPVEPTDRMVLAGVKQVSSESPQTDTREAWDAMVSASPFAGN